MTWEGRWAAVAGNEGKGKCPVTAWRGTPGRTVKRKGVYECTMGGSCIGNKRKDLNCKGQMRGREGGREGVGEQGRGPEL